jgi:conjugative transfer signal peptidase TraF
MNVGHSETCKRQRARRRAPLTLGLAAVTVAAVLSAGFGAGLRINTTPSEPFGLWQIVPMDRAAVVGDLVFVCMPDNPARAEGKSRGYLRWGLCPGGTGPLIKRVVAISGQKVAIDGQVSIDGVALPQSRLAERDGRGRPLRPYDGGILALRQVFLHSPFPGSWDSRYFGPVPVSGILGLAREVLTDAF